MTLKGPTRVRRRRVFFVPGYDPFPPRRYFELYRRESAKQAEISAYDIAIKPGLETEVSGWQVAAMIEGQPVRTDIEVLEWSDIVRQGQPWSVLKTYQLLAQTIWIFLSTGALFGLLRQQRGAVIMALYPVMALLMQAVFAGVLGWAMFRIFTRMGQELETTLPDAIGVMSGLALAVIVVGLTLRWFRDHDSRFLAYHQMHGVVYAARLSGAYPVIMETRLAVFRDKIAEALQGDADEILVVGHSSGVCVAISVLADMLRDGPATQTRTALAFLSLGQAETLVSFLPRSTRLQRDLRDLAQRTDLDWIDVARQGARYACTRCDPAVSGQTTSGGRGPLVISPALSQSGVGDGRKTLGWQLYRPDFEYLRASDYPDEYDYFQITAGPHLLRDRYVGRAGARS